MQTWVDLKFADGAYCFKLGSPQILEIERKAGEGIGAVYGSLVKGRHDAAQDVIIPQEAAFSFTVLIEVIRQGLIGGASAIVDGAQVKITAARANELIENYLIGATDQRMVLTETWTLAFAVLHALVCGYEPPADTPTAEVPATPDRPT